MVEHFIHWDPGVSQDESIEDARGVVTEFCRINGLIPPEMIVERGATITESGPRSKGFYTIGSSTLTVGDWRPVTRTPGFAWSFPGYKADMTVYGVLAHECGHWVQDINGWASVTRKLRGRGLEKRPITPYESRDSELFAGMVRLFLLNPDLLREGRRDHFEFLMEMGLCPRHDEPWESVLCNAHPKFIDQAKKWIAK